MKQLVDLLVRILASALISAGLVANPAIAQMPEKVVPVTSEPSHKIRFDNGQVRVYEVLLPKGKATLMHEHRADNFTIFFNDSEITVETYGGKTALVKKAAGSVGFASTASGPYSHRLTADGDLPFHVMAIELQSLSPKGLATANLRPSSTFQVLLENSRGRVYRLSLAPGASTEKFNRLAGSMLFAISPGRISETISGKPTTNGQPERLWDFEPGHLRWAETSEKLSIKNESLSPIELVEIELF